MDARIPSLFMRIVEERDAVESGALPITEASDFALRFMTRWVIEEWARNAERELARRQLNDE